MSEPRLYFDSAASTPVRPEVWEAMQPYFREKFGNPGSLHSFGQEAIKAVDESREKIAKSLGADFRQIIFTSSATEANNLAFRGTIRKFWWNFFKKVEKTGSYLPHLISTAIEHESVLETLKDVQDRGAAKVTILPVNENGLIDPSAIKNALTPQTILVSVMYVNNEVGTIEDIKKISSIVREFRGNSAYPLLHTDAVQAPQFLSCNPDILGVDLMTLSSHKIYGPKGAALLYVRNTNLLSPLITGGGQEFGIRSGTENVPAIVGFAEAAELIMSEREALKDKISNLASRFVDGLRDSGVKFEINGFDVGNKSRISAILNLRFPGINAETFLTELDLKGFAASSGSACKARALTPSHVLQAMGLPGEKIKESVRISLHKFLTEEDIDRGVKIISETLSHSSRTKSINYETPADQI